MSRGPVSFFSPVLYKDVSLPLLCRPLYNRIVSTHLCVYLDSVHPHVRGTSLLPFLPESKCIKCVGVYMRTCVCVCVQKTSGNGFCHCCHVDKTWPSFFFTLWPLNLLTHDIRKGHTRSRVRYSLSRYVRNKRNWSTERLPYKRGGTESQALW